MDHARDVQKICAHAQPQNSVNSTQNLTTNERNLTMSEIKLNLIDSQQILQGTIHGSIGDACVAALSTEPETITELEAGLARYLKPLDGQSTIMWLRTATCIDERPWDAGIVVIDLAARIVASESTYSQPGPEGQVNYHNGEHSTDVPVIYRLSNDWLFLDSIEEYKATSYERRQKRALSKTFNARPILYGRPLLEFLVSELIVLSNSSHGDEDPSDNLIKEISAIHARWLTTPRPDLRNQSPREIMLARQDFIDFDLHTRSIQWSLQREGPPCLPTDSFAYRFAGFGTHEWVIYYDLVRHLLWSALPSIGQIVQESVRQTSACRVDARKEPSVVASGFDLTSGQLSSSKREETITRLDHIKTAWLEEPNHELDNRIPALIIDNERRRLPEAMLGREMVIDEDCPVCRMMGNDAELGLEVGFWGLDGAHMDDDFAFSSFRTREEWEADRRQWKEFNEEFNRKWEERQQRLARGEVLEPDPYFDPPELDNLFRSEEQPDSDHPAS
jgi:hypothetical protein